MRINLSFICKISRSLYIMILFAKFKISFQYKLLLEKIWILSPKIAIFQLWLSFSQWFWRRFLNFVNVITLFCYYLQLKRVWPFFSTNLKSSLFKDALCLAWLNWLAQRFFFIRRKCERKVNRLKDERPASGDGKHWLTPSAQAR